MIDSGDRRPLRIWPGAVIVTLQLAALHVPAWLAPASTAMFLGMLGSLTIGTLCVVDLVVVLQPCEMGRPARRARAADRRPHGRHPPRRSIGKVGRAVTGDPLAGCGLRRLAVVRKQPSHGGRRARGQFRLDAGENERCHRRDGLRLRVALERHCGRAFPGVPKRAPLQPRWCRRREATPLPPPDRLPESPTSRSTGRAFAGPGGTASSRA